MSWFSRRPRPSVPDGPRPVSQPELPQHRSALPAGASEAEIRNLAMSIVLMWGPSRALPAADRLCHFVPGLDPATAADMIADAQEAERIANNHVYVHSDYSGTHIRYAPRKEVDKLVLGRFPWVDDENLGHVYSQSCYGAWHG